MLPPYCVRSPLVNVPSTYVDAAPARPSDKILHLAFGSVETPKYSGGWNPASDVVRAT